MLSGNNIQGRKNILYGDLFANYSILRVDTVWKGSLENPIWGIHMIAITERLFVVFWQKCPPNWIFTTFKSTARRRGVVDIETVSAGVRNIF